MDALATTSGTGSASVRSGILGGLASRATAEEWDFLARAMLGELRTGALSGVLLDAIARAADRPAAIVRRAAMLSGDLGETARIALTGDEGDLEAVGLRVGRPVLPMLAATAATPSAALEVTGRASVEYKLDGARIQVHRHGDEVGVYTRSLADITHRVPEIVEIVRALPAHDVILDGETLSLDEDGGPRPFQETMSRFGADVSRELVLRPWFFDVLHVDGRDLIDEPLSVRLAELERVVGDWRMPGIVTDDADAAEQLSRDALAAGHEGVVIKAVDAPYAAGRRGKSWVKVKPVLTFDLVVLGAEWGSGRRRGWLSNLHLGARDPSGEFADADGYVMVGKTFKGLTDELLRWQTAEFPGMSRTARRPPCSCAPNSSWRSRSTACSAHRDIPGRRPAIRPSEGLPAGQVAGRGRYDPDAAFPAARLTRRPHADGARPWSSSRTVPRKDHGKSIHRSVSFHAKSGWMIVEGLV